MTLKHIVQNQAMLSQGNVTFIVPVFSSTTTVPPPVYLRIIATESLKFRYGGMMSTVSLKL